VAAVAGPEQIVISQDAVEAGDTLRFPLSQGRVVELKGIKDPVQVHQVDWR
jgi:class 3 adenylate cyclase